MNNEKPDGTREAVAGRMCIVGTKLGWIPSFHGF